MKATVLEWWVLERWARLTKGHPDERNHNNVNITRLLPTRQELGENRRILRAWHDRVTLTAYVSYYADDGDTAIYATAEQYRELLDLWERTFIDPESVFYMSSAIKASLLSSSWMQCTRFCTTCTACSASFHRWLPKRCAHPLLGSFRALHLRLGTRTR